MSAAKKIPAKPLKHHKGIAAVSLRLLPPPAGYSSWLAYAVSTMETRQLLNDHAFDHQPQWPAAVTRKQMRASAEAELKEIETHWREMERAWSGMT